MFFGCDLSHWNYINSFEAVADSVDFVILKAGGSDKGFYTDSTFFNRYDGFHAYDVPVGAYYFVGKDFKGEKAGTLDAMRFVDIIKDLQFEYPLILDLEATAGADKVEVTDAAVSFLDFLEKAGFYAMIYASDISGFKERLDIDRLHRFDKWVARYGSDPKYVKKFGIHQYTSSGYITGISGRVDLDHAFKNYPEIMKQNHLNNY